MQRQMRPPRSSWYPHTPGHYLTLILLTRRYCDISAQPPRVHGGGGNNTVIIDGAKKKVPAGNLLEVDNNAHKNRAGDALLGRKKKYFFSKWCKHPLNLRRCVFLLVSRPVNISSVVFVISVSSRGSRYTVRKVLADFTICVWWRYC